ncbi:hypothetical protein EAF04_008973 [Stromatinia cepivora]|nr:hypothetical protein EAF04_008973 [Stromatinia cepivora]
MKGFKSPVLPLIVKSEEEIGREKHERELRWWRFLGRELMKGVEGEDVRVLGGSYLMVFMGRGVFEFWECVEGVVLGGFGGYGGVGEGEWKGKGEGNEAWGDGMSGMRNSGTVVDKGSNRMEITHHWDNFIGYCMEKGEVKDIVKVEASDSIWFPSKETDDDGEEKFRGYASTSGCGYQWDF